VIGRQLLVRKGIKKSPKRKKKHRRCGEKKKGGERDGSKYLGKGVSDARFRGETESSAGKGWVKMFKPNNLKLDG